MADISKITPPGSQTTYNLKDATAREQAAKNKNNILIVADQTTQYNLSPLNEATSSGSGEGYFGGTSMNIPAGTYIVRYKLTTTANFGMAITVDGTEQAKTLTSPPYNNFQATYTITASTGITFVRFYKNASATVSEFQIIPKSLYDAGFTSYQPYAMSNAVITPELIELVDSGAKNIANWHDYTLTSTTHRGVSFTNNNDGTVTVNTDSQGSTENDAYGNLLTIYTGLPFGLKAGDAIVVASSSDNVRMVLIPYLTDHYGESQVGTKSNPRVWTIPQGITGMVVRLAVSGRGTVVSNEKVSTFICTKSAWDVSQKYVPYRPTYEETVEQVAENKNNISMVLPYSDDISSESQVDDLPMGTLCVSPSVSVAGYSSGSWLIIHTYDMNAAKSRRMQVIESADGTRKTRFKGAGGWGNWA